MATWTDQGFSRRAANSLAKQDKSRHCNCSHLNPYHVWSVNLREDWIEHFNSELIALEAGRKKTWSAGRAHGPFGVSSVTHTFFFFHSSGSR